MVQLLVLKGRKSNVSKLPSRARPVVLFLAKGVLGEAGKILKGAFAVAASVLPVAKCAKYKGAALYVLNTAAKLLLAVFGKR